MYFIKDFYMFVIIPLVYQLAIEFREYAIYMFLF